MWKNKVNALSLMQRRQKMISWQSRCSHHLVSFSMSNWNKSNPLQGQHRRLTRILITRDRSTVSSSRTMTIAPISSLSSHYDHHSSTLRQHQRCFSDNLLGYSPMSKPNPTATVTLANSDDDKTSSNEKEKRIPTSQETTAGGVWAPTSAKRDKLAELNIALEEGQDTLDDAATPLEKQDLYLADGLKYICKVSDSIAATGEDSDDFNERNKEIEELSEFLVQQQRMRLVFAPYKVALQ